MDTPRELTGRIARERILLPQTPVLPPGIAEGFAALGDATGIISDTLDALGIPGTVGASVLRPTLPGRTLVGPALTVRNVIRSHDPFDAARRGVNGMAEFEAHNHARPGDVLVIDGVAGISNMGGISALAGKRAGEVGAVVSGGIRDVAHSRSVDYPVWASEITPVTGKWRIETVEIFGSVQIFGVRVNPGDLVVADDTGVCFVPRDRVEEVLRLAQKKSRAEDERCAAIDRGEPLPAVLRSTPLG